LLMAAVIGAMHFILPYRRAKEESGFAPNYEGKFTARSYVGLGIYGTYITMRVAFYDNFIVLSSSWRRVIPYGSIRLVEYKSLMTSMGIVIHTQNPAEQFALYSGKSQRMIALFQEKGVVVMTGEESAVNPQRKDSP
jgi:hypothetical protein